MVRKTLIAFGALAATASAHAATVSYTDWTYNTDDEIDWLVTIEESTYTDSSGTEQDIFLFDVGIGSGDLVGDIVGFGFNTHIDYGSSVLDGELIAFADSPTFGSCSGSCNWNGTDARNPDYSFAVGNNGLSGSGDDHQSFSFGLLALGNELTAETFSLVAIRATSVGMGDDREESVKDYSSMATVENVPELNGSLASIMFALVASLMGIKRRRD